MSQENVEVVRSWLRGGAFEADDLARVVARFWDETADYYPVSKFPEAAPCHGREEIVHWMAAYADAWSFDHAIHDVIAVGDDRVLAYSTMRAEGRESGIELEGDIYFCFWLRHRRLLRGEDHLTAKGALDALGLDGDTLEAAELLE